MPLFFDTSALTKLYVEEKGTDRMKEIVGRPDLQGGLFVSHAVALEVLGTFSKRFRIAESERQRSRGSLAARRENERLHRLVVDEFQIDYLGGRLSRVEVHDAILLRAVDLSIRLPEKAVSAMDFVHLATTLYLRNELRQVGADPRMTLVVCDRPLAAVANYFNVSTFDPEQDHLSSLS